MFTFRDIAALSIIPCAIAVIVHTFFFVIAHVISLVKNNSIINEFKNEEFEAAKRAKNILTTLVIFTVALSFYFL